jgi:protein involved in polysaccharide export with SLBB domain
MEAPRAPLEQLIATTLASLLLTLALGGRPAMAQSASASLPEMGDSLPLHPGDMIRLRVWREPDLSGDFFVNESGVATLPMIGPVEVTTRPAESLSASIAREFGAFLTHSAIEVAFLRRVQVVGAVQKPGLYHVDPTMTIADALALAGGVAPNGRTDRVEILREGQKLPGSVSGRMLISQSPMRSGDQLYVPERSWISRNPATILAGLSAITALLYTVAR